LNQDIYVREFRSDFGEFGYEVTLGGDYGDVINASSDSYSGEGTAGRFWIAGTFTTYISEGEFDNENELEDWIIDQIIEIYNSHLDSFGYSASEIDIEKIEKVANKKSP
jgi:hypothetical protein